MMDTVSPLPTAPDPAASLLSVVEKGSLLDLDAALQLKVSELNESSGTEGYTPLIVAVTKRNVRMVEKLLAVGANPNIPVSGTGIYGGYTGVHIASKNGDVDILKALHKAGGDVNLEGADSWSPLHVAAFSGKRNTLLCLLDCGAQIDIPNKHALTPLMYVCDHGKVREVRDLLMRGANIHLKDINGDGMLHHALHYQMHKLFEGEYDMPECQYDVVVILTMHGANPDDTNKDEDLPTKFAVDGMRDVLRILYHHHKEFQRSKTEWNYMTLLAAQIEHFLGMGLPLRHATDLYEALKKLEHNRLQHKKEREETRKNQGGCPVIRSKKSVSPSLSHHPEVGSRSDNLTANRSPSSDPSGGQCPFFAMKKEGVEKVHASSHFIEEIDKDDHSPFNEGNERRASTVHSTKPSVPSKESSGLQTSTLKKCPLRSISNCTEDVALPHLTNVTSVCTFLYEHRTVVLLCIICYLLGTLTERKLTSLTHSGGSSSSTSKS